LDADTRARLISLGQDPDKVAEAVAPTTAPTLADHIAALAALVQPVAAAVAPAPVEASPVVTETLAAPEPAPVQAIVTTTDVAPAPVEAAPAVEPYRPIEQVYTAPEIGRTPLSVSMAVEPVIQAGPVINYSPSGQYIESPAEDLNPLTGAPYGTYVEFANDPQVVEFKKNGPALKTQVDGNHYVKCAIQPLDYIMANKLGFVEGNIVKYATRWQDKDGVVDLKKARDYLDKLIAYVEAAS
jgi:hypothetical protein